MKPFSYSSLFSSLVFRALDMLLFDLNMDFVFARCCARFLIVQVDFLVLFSGL